jgi:23S rRNA (cytidine1920-2'-O)/16S rRNA (cytidine1409-2'-O)-methyltransferase
VSERAAIEVTPGPEHVGRGALKLAGALDAFGVDPRGRVAVDVGASTGGFSEVLLARGAKRVYAVDVGRGQLHEKLRGDPRVVVLEGVNARYLSPAEIETPCDLATMDVSFISALKILPALRTVVAPQADLIVLVKPQFELARRDVGRGGIVKDPALHRRALESVALGAEELGCAIVGACASPITGADGNREFFLHLRPSGAALPRERREAMISSVLEP